VNTKKENKVNRLTGDKEKIENTHFIFLI